MKSAFLGFIIVLSLLVISSCRHRSRAREIRGADVIILGMRLGQTRTDLLAIMPSMVCAGSLADSEFCSYFPGEADRKGRFRGVDRVRLGFRSGALKRIRLEYGEMLDVEFAALDGDIRSQYGDKPMGSTPDSLYMEWRYDSVIVSLAPNRRPHWTREVTTYKPVLEIASP
jgi:hypothetical protein